MAINFIPEDGTGLTNSNSFIDLDYFKQYAVDRGISNTYTDDQIKTMLIKATDYINNTYTFLGTKLLTTQSLEFPRLIDGENVYPNKLKYATCELALKSVSSDLLKDTEQQVIRKSLKGMEIEYNPNSLQEKQYNYVSFLLAPYLQTGSLFSHKVVRV